MALWARPLSLERREAERSSAEPLGTGDCRLCFEEHALSAAAGMFSQQPAITRAIFRSVAAADRTAIFSHVTHDRSRRPARHGIHTVVALPLPAAAFRTFRRSVPRELCRRHLMIPGVVYSIIRKAIFARRVFCPVVSLPSLPTLSPPLISPC